MTSSIIPETYEGREQAMVKHALLKSYLEKLVLIKLFKQCHCIAPDFQNGSMIGHLSFLKHFPWNHTPLA